MKTELTTKQSQHLIELGVPKEKASDKWYFAAVDCYYPIFNLTDLLEILPKELEEDEITYRFRMEDYFGGWLVGHYNKGIPYYLDKVFTAEELIDALYELVIWCIENGHLKFD